MPSDSDLSRHEGTAQGLSADGEGTASMQPVPVAGDAPPVTNGAAVTAAPPVTDATSASNEVSTSEVSTSGVSPSEVSTSEVSTDEVGTSEVSTDAVAGASSPKGAEGRGEGRGELRVAARRGSAFTIGAFVNGFLQFAFLALITHTIDQRDVGALLEAIAIFTIGSNIAELGADSGLLRMMPVFHRRRPQDLQRLARVSVGPALIASVLAAVLVYLYAPQLSDIFVHHASKANTSTDLRIIALFLPISTGSTVICAGLRTWSARQPVILNNFVVPIGRPVLFTAFLLIGVNAKLALIAWGVPTVAVFFLAAGALARHLRETPTSGAELAPVASYRSIGLEFWRFSAPRTFAAMFQVLVTYVDVLLVGADKSAGKAAAYAVASRYVLFATFALGAVVSAVATQLSRLMDAKSYGKANAVYKSATWWTSAASWPPLLVLAVFSPLFMTIFGRGYRSGASALTILALAMLVSIGTGPNGLLILMSGRSGVNLLLQGIGLVINIGLNLWLIPRLGLIGAAISWTATILVTCTLASVILWRKFRIEPFGRGYLVVCLAAGGCFGVLGLLARLLFGTGVVTFIVFSIVSCTLYALALCRARKVLNLDAFESVYSRLNLRARRLRSAKAPSSAS